MLHGGLSQAKPHDFTGFQASAFVARRCRRQRSEQYCTSSQHFSHFLRQVIGFWHCLQ
ncbi:hypothetical protein PANA5342_2265 [Pantoea ananatis LMG 5342]|nr:hypothetical protein PANA5342_2265 [Pantoea ananatis LMG 5342]